MSSTAPWLSRQRKTELAEMADAAGMKNFKSLKKTDLEDELDNFLRANQTTLLDNPKLADFYRRITDSSPAASGKELVKAEAKTPSKPRRRTTIAKVAEDILSDSETPIDANTLRTPASRQSLGVPANIPLPPSPAVVAQAIEHQTARLSTAVNTWYTKTGFQKHVEHARDQISTSYAVTTAATALEAVILLWVLLPMKYLGLVTPDISVFGLPSYHLRAPQFWNLLEQRFWSTTFLWSVVSVILPAAAAYLINLPHKAKRSSKAGNTRFDPFIFNLAKGLLTWLVFTQQISLPTYALKASRVEFDMDVPGGHLWLLVSSLVLRFDRAV